MLITLGTGIGSAVFVDGILVPNTELGHLPLHHDAAEDWAAESVREQDDLSWREWAHRVEKYLELVERLLWPDLIVVGGGVSKKSDKFLPYIDLRTEVVPAQLHNDAGIVGAALFAPPPVDVSGAPPPRVRSGLPPALEPSGPRRPACPAAIWMPCRSTPSVASAWTPSRRPTPATPAHPWASRPWPTRSGSASCASTRRTRSGPTATASCSPRATPPRCSGRCCTWPGCARSTRTTRCSASRRCRSTT